MIAILTESFGGKWPFWLSPNQVIVITIASVFDPYAIKVRDQLHEAGFQCEVDLDAGTTLNKKVRNSQLNNYNFILVVGEKEQANNTVNVRTRDNKVHGEVSVTEVIRRFNELAKSKTNNADDDFGTLGGETPKSQPPSGATGGAATATQAPKSADSSKSSATEGEISSKYC